MQGPNLELSNIALKQQHYLPQQKLPSFNFQLEPITHKQQKYNIVEQKMQLRNKQLKERKQLMQKSQRMRRDLLLQKIAAKNQRFELRKRGQKQNMRVQQYVLAKKNKYDNNRYKIQNLGSVQKQKQRLSQIRSESNGVQKIYVNNKLSSTKGFNTNKQKRQQMRKTFNQHSIDNQGQYKQIKLKAIKLPQLNYAGNYSYLPNNNNLSQNKQFVNGKQQIISSQINQIQQLQKQNNKVIRLVTQQPTNPLLKIHDTRYFGIQQRTNDYYKIGKNLFKQIRTKYWCYDSLDNQQVYNNFQQLLFNDLA